MSSLSSLLRLFRFAPRHVIIVQVFGLDLKMNKHDEPLSCYHCDLPRALPPLRSLLQGCQLFGTHTSGAYRRCHPMRRMMNPSTHGGDLKAVAKT